MRVGWGVVLLTVSCGGVPRVPVPASVPPLVHGAPSPEVERLASDLYENELSLDELDRRASAVLGRFPTASKAHEVAMWVALLRGDMAGAWLHALRGVADLDADAPEIFLPYLASGLRSRAEVSMQLLDELRRAHPKPAIRALATAELASLDEAYGRFSEAEELSRSLGYIDAFQVLGSLHQQDEIRVTITLPTEASLVDEISLRGVRGAYLRQLSRNRADARRQLESIASALFPSSRVQDVQLGDAMDIGKPATVDLRLDDSHMLRSEDDAYRFSPPRSFELSGPTALSKRVTPLDLGPPSSSVYDTRIQLPAGYQASHVPAPFTVTHPCFTLSRTTKVDGEAVALHVEYERRCAAVPVAEYPDFRDAAERASYALMEELVFKKSPAPAKSGAVAAKKP